MAELVAEGLQTKQVAAALFVSPKTVEGHLTNIYAKLGVHSRGGARSTPHAQRLAKFRDYNGTYSDSLGGVTTEIDCGSVTGVKDPP